MDIFYSYLMDESNGPHFILLLIKIQKTHVIHCDFFRFPKVGPTEGLELKRRFHDEFLLVELHDFNLGVGINLLLNEVDSLEFHFLSIKGRLRLLLKPFLDGCGQLQDLN